MHTVTVPSTAPSFPTQTPLPNVIPLTTRHSTSGLYVAQEPTGPRLWTAAEAIEFIGKAEAFHTNGRIITPMPQLAQLSTDTAATLGALLTGMNRQQIQQVMDAIDDRWPHGHFRGTPLPAPHRSEHLDVEIWLHRPNPVQAVPNGFGATNGTHFAMYPTLGTLSLIANDDDETFTCPVAVADAGDLLEAVVTLVHDCGPSSLTFLKSVCDGDLHSALRTARDALT